MTGKEKTEQNTGKRQKNGITGRSGERTFRATNRTAERQKTAGRNKASVAAVPPPQRTAGKVFKATNRTAEREKALAGARKKTAGKQAATEGGRQEVGRWVQIRLIPIWLRVLLFLIGVVLAAVLGVMFGYGVIGDGKALDALKPETWQHIWKMIKGDV
ncbi:MULTISPECIES: DNA-directed RNA polymerase subunit beta [Bhargavaea]|uniref:DNA-directed RNA polymerase subunit beta n=1 Tax=Bhargavaea changchunensis TaxID=2134037 RepID=A0ABW2NGU0_9BACL|nr:DNA-directed RNA polymerase subunit beta [Bhargavaea sp. CC-171006]